jgi:hypothetical protein
MLASKLINKLQEMIDEYGDKHVQCDYLDIEEGQITYYLLEDVEYFLIESE